MAKVLFFDHTTMLNNKAKEKLHKFEFHAFVNAFNVSRNLMRTIISIIILIIGMTSCNQEIVITGHWRPADALGAGQGESGVSPQFRDLFLNSDSTFIAAGLEQQPEQTKGWHNGATQKGKWNYSDGSLSLWIDGVRRPVKFKVLKLTKREIIMEGEYMKSVEVKLIRLKDFG